MVRNSSFKYANQRRPDPNIFADDFVLVNNKRWPNKTWPKLSPPWQGHFKVLKVRFNSLQVAASPSLGGVIEVSMQLCKKWTVELESESLVEDMNEEENQDTSLPREVEPPLMTKEEQEQLGFYNVYKIMKHPMQGGTWRFLVWWENFSPSASTWEPTQSFVLPNGELNEVFKRYCLDHNLHTILRRALRMFVANERECQRMDEEHRSPPEDVLVPHFQAHPRRTRNGASPGGAFSRQFLVFL